MNLKILTHSLILLALVISASSFLFLDKYEQQRTQSAETISRMQVNQKKNEINQHISHVVNTLKIMSESTMIKRAFNDFEWAFKQAANELRPLVNYDRATLELKKFYEKQKQINPEIDYSELTVSFSETTRLMQHAFLATNSNEEKKISYDKILERYHPLIQNYKGTLSIDEIYFIGNNGSIIYTAGKSLDFATNIKRDAIVKNIFQEIGVNTSGLFPCVGESSQNCFYATHTILDNSLQKMGTIFFRIKQKSIAGYPYIWKNGQTALTAMESFDLGNAKVGLNIAVDQRKIDLERKLYRKEVMKQTILLFFAIALLLYALMVYQTRKFEIRLKNLMKNAESDQLHLIQLKKALSEFQWKISEAKSHEGKLINIIKKLGDAYQLIENSCSQNKTQYEKVEELTSLAATAVKEFKQNFLESIGMHEEKKYRLTQVLQNMSEVSQKIKVINDIAFQTKLIAFNATVEGTRVGDNNTYFKVVANEISDVAHQNAKIVNDIKICLDSFQNQMESLIRENDLMLEGLLTNSKVKLNESEKSLEDFSSQSVALGESLNRLSILSFGSSELLKKQSKLLDEMFLLSDLELDRNDLDSAA